MRCKNTICREVFEVREENQASPTPEPPVPEVKPIQPPAVTGGVGDVVPVLTAEAVPSPAAVPEKPPRAEAVRPGAAPATQAEARPVANPAPAPAPEVSPYSQAPPVRRPVDKKPAPPAPKGEPVAVPRVEALPDDLGFPGDDEADVGAAGPATAAPREVGAGAWQAPPIRRDVPVPASPLLPMPPLSIASGPTLTTQPPSLTSPARKSRLSLVLISIMLVVLAASFGGGMFLLSGKSAQDEADRFKKAQDLYASQEFDDAVSALQKLQRDYPRSKDRPQYDFLVELSAVRQAVYSPQADAEERAGALKRVREFLDIYRNDPVLKEYHGDIRQTLVKLARELVRLAENKQDSALLEEARQSWAEASKWASSGKVEETDKALQEDFTRVDNMLAARRARQNLLDALKDLVTRGTADAVAEGTALGKTSRDAEVVSLVVSLKKAHRARIQFTLAPLGGDALSRPPAEDDLANFYIAPQVGKVAGNIKISATALALARGVLYALDVSRGEVRWLRRVGVDTHLLPVRVPASALAPELVLVLESDTKSVAALNAETGMLRWRHVLGAACLGQPVLVDHHLLVPTLSGRVEEIEATGGKLRGWYDLGQMLLVGGVRQPDTSLVYFAADHYCVYVLDVARRTCAAILYTGHAAGSLRGLPSVWNESSEPLGAPKKNMPGHLLLTHASSAGLGVLPYSLPLKDSDQKPDDLNIKLRGDTSAGPWHDGKTWGLATDAGLLGLYGIRQAGDRDPLLFPLYKGEYRLESEERARRGAALLVHADSDNYWAICGGRLHRLQAAFTAAQGPKLVERWPQPVEIGSPLHEGQFVKDSTGRALLVLAMQDVDRPICWVRAIDADSGQVLWQRQLGLICQDQPLAGASGVLARDVGGLVYVEHTTPGADTAWQPTGKLIATDENQIGWWAAQRDKGFVCLSWGRDKILHVRLVDDKGTVSTRSHPQIHMLRGTPALVGDFVVAPLADGNTWRFPLGQGEPISGPEWRGPGVEETQPGHVVALGTGEFAVSDGGQAVKRIHWGEGKSWDVRGRFELPHRITGPPIMVAMQPKTNGVVVADASDTLTLLDGERLQPLRRWAAGGKITAGPFVRGQGFGVVVGKTRLVWYDPGKDEQAWVSIFDAPIVGQPQLMGDVLIVADLQGAIVALDPATGDPLSPGYRLKCNQAPSATPVAFGTGQLLVPLLDGTAMVLPMERLR